MARANAVEDTLPTRLGMGGDGRFVLKKTVLYIILNGTGVRVD